MQTNSEIGRKSTKRSIDGLSPTAAVPASKNKARKSLGVDHGTSVTRGRGVDSKISADQAVAAGLACLVTQKRNARSKKFSLAPIVVASGVGHRSVVTHTGHADSKPIGRKSAQHAMFASSPTVNVPTAKTTRRKAAREANDIVPPTVLFPHATNSASDGGGVDHKPPVNPDHCVDSKNSARQHEVVNPLIDAREPGLETDSATLSASHTGLVTQTSAASGTSINRMIDMCRQRRAWMVAELRLTLQCSGICRALSNDDKVAGAKLLASLEKAFEDGEIISEQAGLQITLIPLMNARIPLREQRAGLEKLIKKEVRNLPAYEWVKNVKGFGEMSFGTIIGETGDLANYSNPAKVWKRMGLAVIDGARQGNPGKGASAEDWERHGYVSRRRSTVWNGGNGIIGCMGRGPRLAPGADPDEVAELTEYQRLFVKRLRIEGPRLPKQNGETVVVNKETGEQRETFSKHAANRAKRYVEKRVLRDLWREWRRAIGLPLGEPHLDSD